MSTRLRGGNASPTMTEQVQAHLASVQLLPGRLEPGVAFPARFCRFLFSSCGFFSPSGAFFLSSGLVGCPLPCFSLPLGPCGSSFFWVGWVPLPRFPGVSPMFLGRVGLVFCVFVSPATSCVLHLSSLATRTTWSTDPQTPRPPPPFSLVRRS